MELLIAVITMIGIDIVIMLGKISHELEEIKDVVWENKKYSIDPKYIEFQGGCK